MLQENVTKTKQNNKKNTHEKKKGEQPAETLRRINTQKDVFGIQGTYFSYCILFQFNNDG